MSSEGVIYKATVITNSSTEKYVGHMADRFRGRYSKNIQHLDEHENRKKTALAGHVCDLKDKMGTGLQNSTILPHIQGLQSLPS